MNYTFSINKYIDPISGLEKSNPLVDIENQEKYGWYFYDEINNISSDLEYVKEIVSKLEAVLNGELEFYQGFGYEVYMIECDKENAVVKNIFEDDKIDAVIPTLEVYELIRDWKIYLEEFNNRC